MWGYARIDDNGLWEHSNGIKMYTMAINAIFRLRTTTILVCWRIWVCNKNYIVNAGTVITIHLRHWISKVRYSPQAPTLHRLLNVFRVILHTMTRKILSAWGRLPDASCISLMKSICVKKVCSNIFAGWNLSTFDISNRREQKSGWENGKYCCNGNWFYWKSYTLIHWIRKNPKNESFAFKSVLFSRNRASPEPLPVPS